MPDVFVLGGPNGAGKTTAASVLLPKQLELLEFVNADEIARGLSPFDEASAAMPAGRIMLDRMRHLIATNISFAFETTCASRTHANMLQQCKRNGWRVSLLYLWLSSPQLAIERVANRVREGGHSVPSDIVKRRYRKGLANMRRLYLEIADVVAIFDNGGKERILIAERRSGEPLTIHDSHRWALIEQASS